MSEALPINSAPPAKPLIQTLDALSVLTLIAGAIFLVGFGLPSGHDAAAHALWGHTMADGWAQGQPWPRWVDAADQGLGNPGLLYYPPLTAWLTAPLLLLGFDTSRALGTVAFGAVTLLALGTDGLVRRGRTDTALSGRLARLFVLGPYLAYNVAVRAALAETLGLALLVMLLLAIRRLGNAMPAQLDKSPGSAASTGAATTAPLSDFISATLGLGLVGGLLLLAHPLTAALAAPLELAEGFRAGLHRRLGAVLVAATLAFGLSAGLWLPLLSERDRVQYDRLFEGGAALRNQQALRPPSRAEPPLSRRRGRIALVQLAILATVLGVLVFQGPRAGEEGRSIALDALLCLGFLFLATSAAEPLNVRLPWLAAAQYPWRHLGPATIAGALAIAVALGARCPETRDRSGSVQLWITSLLSLALSLGLTVHLAARGHPANPKLDDVITSAIITPEYRPLRAPGPERRTAPDGLLRTLQGDAEIIGRGPSVLELRIGPSSCVELAIHSDQGWSLKAHETNPSIMETPDQTSGPTSRDVILDRSRPRLRVTSRSRSETRVRLIWTAPRSARIGATISTLTALLILVLGRLAAWTRRRPGARPGDRARPAPA